MWAVARPPRLHPEAVAFAEQYGFAIWLAAAYRPQSKGRVERQVEVVRSHVLDGRTFDSLTAMDAAFAAWLPVRRAAVHRTHGEVTRVRAEPDRAAAWPAARASLRRVRPAYPPGRQGRPGLLCGQPSSVPWRQVRPGGRVEPLGHPGRGRDLVAGPPTAAAGRPHPRSRTRRLGGRRGALGRPAQPGRCPTDPALHGRLRARPATRTRVRPATAARHHRLGPGPCRPHPGRPPAPCRLRRARGGGIVSELVATRIREHAERLRLAWLADNLDALVTRAEQAQMGYLEFVDLALEEEVGLREGRRFRNALKLSGLPHHKGLDAFDFAFQPDLDARKVRDLAALEFVEQKANVLAPRPARGRQDHACGRPSHRRLPGRLLGLPAPPWTTWSETSARPSRPAGSPRSCRPTSNPLSWWSTKWGISRWPAPTPTWSSSSSPAGMSAARSCSPPTRRSANGAASSATTCSPPRSWTGCC